MPAIRVRVRWTGGTATVTDLESEAPFQDLISRLAEIVNSPTATLQIKAGFPPRLVSGNDTDPISAVGIVNGDTLQIDIVPVASIESIESTESTESLSAPLPQIEGFIARRIIASDNSCLFNAVGYVLEGHSRAKAAQLRKTVVEAIRQNPEQYSEVVLGKPVEDYCQWISEKDHWGGAIELSILARAYSTKIYAIDVQTLRVDRYGEDDASFDKYSLLLYDGIHYDALAMCLLEGGAEEFDVTVFACGDGEGPLQHARALATQLHKEHQFTDTSSFSLRCLVCKQGLVGQTEAQKHARETGHQSYGEYIKE